MKSIAKRIRSVSDAVSEYFSRAQQMHNPLAAQSTLFDFASPTDVQRFELFSDRAYGGDSSCSLEVVNRGGFRRSLFSGVIDASSGSNGFVSFRTKPDYRPTMLTAYTGFRLRLKTDGRRYMVIIRCQDMPPQDSYFCALETPAGEWCTVEAPFNSFIKMRRGAVAFDQVRRRPDAVEAVGLDPEAIISFGVVLVDDLAGPFRLELQQLEAIRDVEGHAPTATPASNRLLGRGGRAAQKAMDPARSAAHLDK